MLHNFSSSSLRIASMRSQPLFQIAVGSSTQLIATSHRHASSFSSTSKRKPPSLLTLADLSVAQIQSLIDLSAQFKAAYYSNSYALPASSRKQLSANEHPVPQSLKDKQIAVLFTKRSTRTRIASETSISALGGHPIFLAPSDIQLGVNESLLDSAKVISSMTHGIMARVGSHEEIETLAEHSSQPVVNALSARYHPTQILADLLTMVETYGSASAKEGSSLRSLAGLKVAWVGDSNNILNDMIVSFPRLGIDLSIATPPAKGAMYARDEVVWETAHRGIEEHRALDSQAPIGKLEWTHDPRVAVRHADILVTDTWISMGDEASKDERLRDFDGFQITEKMAAEGGAKGDWKFMHCLPRKPQEVDDEVFYGNRSLVFPEAENRKWSIMAIFDRVFGNWSY